MNNHSKTTSPWFDDEVQHLVKLLLNSHQRAFKRCLLAELNCSVNANNSAMISQELFNANFPVLAHNRGEDPQLNYANSAALKLWDRSWDMMIGMPSKMTAPSDQRQSRSEALKNALNSHAIEGYGGIRVNSKGQIFSITNARIWTIWDDRNRAFGQAASFKEWHWL